MENTLFEIIDFSDTRVIIKVTALNALDVAFHPFLDSKMAYISVQRGAQPTFSVINHDGHVTTRFTLTTDDRHVEPIERELASAVKNFAAQKPIFINQCTDALPESIRPIINQDTELPYSLVLHFENYQDLTLDFKTKFDRQQYIDTKLPQFAN